ncbi:SH3 domain-containing protein [Streptomyces sp. NPDC001315]|uniref:SH3 domain-containing protein n=1 Tax=Streptomyces sp. NPDC001315 TaxID=3364562 RepID=UPI0036C09FD7
MFRRTVQSGLLAAVAVLAFLPAAAGAAPMGATTAHPALAATTQHALPSLLSTPARHAPARHHTVHRVHCARHHMAGRVATHRLALNVRSGPGTGYRVLGHRHNHRLVSVACKRYGSGVFGNHVWYRLAHHKGYVAARYVRVGAAVPWC